MSDDFESDTPEIVILPQVRAQMEADPEIAEFIRDFSASMRQAMTGVSSGQYASLEDAMEAITGFRPIPIDEDFDDEPDEEEDSEEDEDDRLAADAALAEYIKGENEE